ncbi:MAG: Long-chain-fatty-acid--CoA ligase, partial [uncultured Acetobacteraceae bacterium]
AQPSPRLDRPPRRPPAGGYRRRGLGQRPEPQLPRDCPSHHRAGGAPAGRVRRRAWSARRHAGAERHRHPRNPVRLLPSRRHLRPAELALSARRT